MIVLWVDDDKVLGFLVLLVLVEVWLIVQVVVEHFVVVVAQALLEVVQPESVGLVPRRLAASDLLTEVTWGPLQVVLLGLQRVLVLR